MIGIISNAGCYCTYVMIDMTRFPYIIIVSVKEIHHIYNKIIYDIEL